jgi:hypothetical protein
MIVSNQPIVVINNYNQPTKSVILFYKVFWHTWYLVRIYKNSTYFHTIVKIMLSSKTWCTYDFSISKINLNFDVSLIQYKSASGLPNQMKLF